MDARFFSTDPTKLKTVRANSVRPRKFTEADGIPDITPRDLVVLNELWNIGLNAEVLPDQAFTQAFTRHYHMMKPYMVKVEKSHDNWYAYWTLMYRALLDLRSACAKYDLNRHYSEPYHLHWQREQARGQLINAQTAYEQAKEDYYNETEWRNSELSYLYDLQGAVKKAEDLESIRKIEAEHIRLDGAGREARKASKFVKESDSEDTNKRSGKSKFHEFFMKIFPCLDKSENAIAEPPTSATAEERAEFLKVVKEDLIEKYSAEIHEKEEEYNGIFLLGPSKEFQRAYERTEDESLHHRLVAYREQNKEVMHHCLRLYVLSMRLYVTMYGHSPVDYSLDKEKSETAPTRYIRDSSEVIADKIQPIFKQMIRGSKSMLDLFYCLQPDKVYFQDYLRNFNDLPNSAERLSFMRGDNIPEIIDKVFVEFETPEEAYHVLKNQF